MWLGVKAMLARWLFGRTLGGVLGVLLTLFLPLAGVLKLLGVPLLIALVLLGAPLFLLLAAGGLPIALVLVVWALRWVLRKLRGDSPPTPNDADGELGHS